MQYENIGDSVIPCTLASNVKDLHQLLFPEMSYTPSYRVQDISTEIVSTTGMGSYDDYRYDNNSSNDDTESYDDSYNDSYDDTEDYSYDDSYGDNYSYDEDYSEDVY